MAALTQALLSEQMVAQLRLLKPSISAEVGTPERLILDVSSGAIAESSIDLIGLQEALNVDSKFGSNLTNFMAIFGFARQGSATSTGFVIFSRTAPANIDIVIKSGTLLKSHVATTTDGILPEFVTTADVTLRKGELETPLCPVQAVAPGGPGNVPTNAITIMNNTFAFVQGITAVTNPSATTGGSNTEDDNSLKARFKNTVFRNLAGTKDQFLALAVATAFSTKANVIGPLSKYQEYIEVPKKSATEGDDTTEYAFGGGTAFPGTPTKFMVRGDTMVKILTVPSTLGMKREEPVVIYQGKDNPEVAYRGRIEEVKNTTELVLEGTPPSENVVNGFVMIGAPEESMHVNQWTTALSDNPFAKDVWTHLPVFISDLTSGVSKFFFREDVDYLFNYPAKVQGDTLRALIDGIGLDPRTDLTGDHQPNVTFTNVLIGGAESVKAITPGSIILLEYPYLSHASRNSIEHNVTNAVDVYIDGGNEQPTSTIFTAPLSSVGSAFVDEPTSMYHYENFRRDGEPAKRPDIGNILTPLFNQPLLSLPPQVTLGKSIYYLNVHYWLVHDVSDYAGTIRARDGIEWTIATGGDEGGAKEGVPTVLEPEPEYKGTNFSALCGIVPATTIEMDNYTYDANIAELQAAYEGSRQITTDTLAHKARIRFFKFDITVIYAPQATPSVVNGAIREALARFFDNQFFGSVIRLSDILAQVHNVAGVQNVRWSNDVPNTHNLTRVYETDNNSLPLRGITSDRLLWGTASIKEEQGLYIVGQPTEGEFGFKEAKSPHKDPTKEELLNVATATAAQLETEINKSLSGGLKVTVTEDKRSTTNILSPIRSFRIVYSAKGQRELPLIYYDPVHVFGGGEYAFDSDFFLRDNELPALPAFGQEADTVPGLIIRARAENVWQKA